MKLEKHLLPIITDEQGTSWVQITESEWEESPIDQTASLSINDGGDEVAYFKKA